MKVSDVKQTEGLKDKNRWPPKKLLAEAMLDNATLT
jgi:hypothetical protein